MSSYQLGTQDYSPWCNVNAIGFGFVAGVGFGIFFLRLVLLRVPVLSQLPDLGYCAVALALAVRFYFLAMSRAREAKAPNC